MIIDSLDVTKYKRFFAFGDSFTNYYWPTWADIIGNEIPIYQNWGLKGSGNHFIFNSIIECNQRHKFTQGDLVIVMWTGCTREDRYVNNQWVTAATAYRETLYGKEWVQRFGSDTRGLLLRDIAYIKAIQTLLEHSGVDYAQLNSIPIARNGSEDVIHLYSDVLSQIKPSLHMILEGKGKHDSHPSPEEAIEYLKEYLNFTPKSDGWKNVTRQDTHRF